MKQIVQTMPGYRLNEYQLVIMPNEDLRHRIMRVREDFARRYQLEKPSSAPVHFPLIRFSQIEMMEEKVRNALKGIARGIQPFRIELKDYASLPSHSIYLKTASRSPLEDLVRQLRQGGRVLRSSAGEPQFLQDFNIVVANRLLPWQFEQGWNDYQHRSFNARTMVDGLLLLRKTLQSGKFAVVEHFPCLNLPVLTRQGVLF